MTRSAARESLRAELDAALDRRQASDERTLYKGVVAGASGDDVIVELGPRVQGVVPRAEFDAPPETGASLELALRGREDGLWLFSTRAARALATWGEIEPGALVQGRVIGMNKGGLELKVDGLNAFLPASQIALSFVEDLAAYAGQVLVVEVVEVDREKKRIVVSRRRVLEVEREQTFQDSVGGLSPGAVVRGRVKRLEAYGAFVEIAPGVEGLLHVSNIAHRAPERPDDALQIGQEVDVRILDVTEGGKRIGLGMKQLQRDPWDDVPGMLAEDQIVTGRVVRVLDFGAFVEVLPGVDGLLHASRLSRERVPDARRVLSPGQEVTVRVARVDAHQKKIWLTRLDERGAVLGSDDAIDRADVAEVLERDHRPLGTNLGALFKKALDGRSRS